MMSGEPTGDITIQAGGLIDVDRSQISSAISLDQRIGTGIGKGRDINIKAHSLSLSNGSSLRSDTFGQAEGNLRSDAGNIQVNLVDDLIVNSGSNLLSSTVGEGDAGNITINAGGDVSFKGLVSNGSLLARTPIQ
jgi:hypothetical protein